MKTQLLCLLGFILCTNLSFSQPEKQWLIWKSNGKVGTTYPTTNVINTQFELLGIKSPDLTSNPSARNDIFIIYSDGTHLNSRYQANPGFFYNANDFPSGNQNHNFNKATPGNVSYLYLTNRYEEDDLPQRLSVQPGNPSGVPHTYNIGTSSSNMLSADHDVVYNKDITVIINYDSLRSFTTKDSPEAATYNLRFDGIQTGINQPVSLGNDVLDLQPVFGSGGSTALSAVYNGPTTVTPGEVVSLNPGTDHYGYVNFRKTSTAFPPLPNGDPQFYAVFTLSKNSQFVRALAEPIRASHDPNYLEVKSICQADDGSYLVTYHLQFENTSNVQADSLKVKVKFPSQFDLSCLKIIEWHVVQACTGRLKLSGNTCTFIFHNLFSIIHNRTDRSKGIGYVEFKVKVSAGVNLADPANSLSLGTPIVYFDALDFPLEEFRDLIACKEKGDDHPEVQQNATKDDNLKNGGKKADSDKESKPSNSAQADDMGHIITSSPHVGGSFNCMRPISHENCECNKPFCWKWVWVAIAAAALVLAFLVLRKRKKKL
ncbi:MAG: hypothetical protein WAT91_04485 [Saprospiraceae bacterium]